MFTTYLLGAGASAGQEIKAKTSSSQSIIEQNGIPIVQNFNQDFLSIFNGMINSEMFIRENPSHNMFSTDVKWLEEGLLKHRTFDTFAKRLELTNKVLLVKLKNLLSFYFFIKQDPIKIDNRYDYFLANILVSSTHNLINWPEEIRIISWNYDCQIELAFEKYSGDKTISVLMNKLKVKTNHQHNSTPISDDKNPLIVKLNGQAGHFYKSDGTPNKLLDNLYKFNDDEKKQFVLRYYADFCESSIHSSLYFAWEDASISRAHINQSKNIISNSSKLIIIGYSFPYYNRMIDKEILSNIGELQEIVIQDKFPERIKSRLLQRLDPFFRNRSDLKIRTTDEIDDFILPED